MPDDLIDLTKARPTEAFSTFHPSDAVLIAVTGGVGYLAKEAYKHFFPGAASIVEQIEVLTKLVAACGAAGAKSLKVRVSTNTQFSLPTFTAVKEAKVVAEGGGTIDLEIFFWPPQRPRRRKAPVA